MYGIQHNKLKWDYHQIHTSEVVWSKTPFLINVPVLLGNHTFIFTYENEMSGI